MKSLAILALCAMMMASSVSAESERCYLCDAIITYADSKLKNNATEREVKAALVDVCLGMRRSLVQPCKNFITTHGDEVIHYMMVQDPRELCIRLEMCTANLAAGKSDQNSQQCSVCKMVFTMVDQKLTKNRTITEIEHVLDKICGKLPKAVSSECTNLVNSYGPAAVKYFVAHVKPKTICTELKLCKPAKSDRQHPKHY